MTLKNMETLRYVVLVNGLLTVVSVAYYALLRRETFFGANRLALWLGLAAVVILPLLELPDWRPQPVRTAMQRTAQVIVPKVLPKLTSPQPDVTITFPDQKTYPAFQPQPKRFAWSWLTGLLALYAIGVLLLLIRFGIQLISLRKLIRQSVQEMYDDFTLVRNQGVTSPFSFFSWVVLNPNQHTPDELEQILRHERVHVRERHSLDMLGAEMVCIVFWFNPAAYLFRNLLHQTLEFSADRAVLAEGVDAKSYQYNLLKVSLSAGQSTLTNHFSKSQLNSRITMLNRQESPRATWLKYPVFFFVALTVASVFARPHAINRLSKYVPTPVMKTNSATTGSLKEPSQLVQPIAEGNQKINRKTIEWEPSTQQSLPQPDLIRNPSVIINPSRYTEIRDNTLFWIITPLTTFDDITQLKSEMAKYGYKFEVDEMKFDRLHKFLVRMDVTVSSEQAQSRRTTDDVQENKPMNSFGGQISITKAGILGANEISRAGAYPTKALQTIALADQQIAQDLLEQNRIDYLIAEGLSLTKDKWVSRQYRLNADNQSLLKMETGISFKDSGQLRIIQDQSTKFWLNNHPATVADIQTLTADKIYSVITRDKFTADKNDSQRIILIYTKQ